jgi:hypothetical protein
MRIDDSSLGEPSRECPTAAQLVELFQTAYRINWKQLSRPTSSHSWRRRPGGPYARQVGRL